MEWLTSLLTEHSVIQAVIVVSLVSAVGLALGKISMWGVSLGVTFVFFVGIVAGHFGLSIDPQMLNYAESFGLIIFVYALGVQVGPGFFSSLGKGGLKLNMLAMLVVLLGIVMTLGFHWTTGVSLPDMVGILSGAVTNTPALGAAQQTLKQLNDPAIQQSDLALGCAVAYPLGVVGVILAVILVRKLFASSIFFKKSDEDSHKKTVVIGFLVSNPGVFGKTIQEIARQSSKKFVVSRLWRNEKVIIPASDTMVKEGDCLLMITTEGDVEALTMLIGKRDTRDWNKEDIDWNAIDSQLISRRIVVTRNRVNGVKLGSLRLRNLYGINITRVNRAGIDLVASRDLRLQIGDKLTIVGEANSVNNVGKILGDELKRLDNPNLLAIFVGLTLGVLIGAIPIAIPGMSTPIKLGIAGGPIIVGILMGAFGPRFHLTTYTTQSANLMMRQFGIVIYLAGLGIDSGAHFFETVFRAEGLLWIGLGFLLTIVPVLIVGFIASQFFKLDYAHNIGMLCGSMANPMALSYANTTVEGDEPSVSYATVYPLSMFIRVISAQLLIMLFT